MFGEHRQNFRGRSKCCENAIIIPIIYVLLYSVTLTTGKRYGTNLQGEERCVDDGWSPLASNPIEVTMLRT